MLKYVFTAQFNDGEILEQAQEDVSRTNPKKSAFFDVLNDTRKVERFWIAGHGKRYLVDLTDGHFEVNGDSFFIHEQTVDESKKLSNFRLIYFRRNQVSLNIENGEATDGGQIVIFALGWQANYSDGSNEKAVIYVE